MTDAPDPTGAVEEADEAAAADEPVRLSPWDRFFFAPESPSPVALLRAAWGVLAAIWALTLLPDIDPFLTEGALRYDRPRGAGSWNLLDHLPDGAPLVVCIVLVVAGITTAIGYRSRLSTVVAALAMLSLQRTNTTIFNSGDLVLRQIGVVLALAPSGLLLSVDQVLARRKRAGAAADPPRRAPWAIRLLQIDLALGYALTAWAKLRGATWHDGTALLRALRIEDLQRFVLPDWLLHQSVLLNALTWATLVFEATFLLLVWDRRWRPWVIGAGIFFHLGIDVTFDVGFFSYAMIAGYLAFLPPEVADRWIAWIEQRLPWRRRPEAEPAAPSA